VIQLTGDLAGLLDWLEVEEAVFVGHDWGAATVWNMALIHADRVRAVAGLSVPFAPRAAGPPLEIIERRFRRRLLHGLVPRARRRRRGAGPRRARTMTSRVVWTAEWAAEDGEAEAPPAWLSEEDLAFYVETFERTGFSGGLNYYRNIDRNWELTAPYAEQRITQPSMFLTGDADGVRRFMPGDDLEEWLTDLRARVVIPGGHWIQQERPMEVNNALLEFFAGLDAQA